MSKPNVPQDNKYNITILCRHFDLTKSIEEYVAERIHRVDPIAQKIREVTVTLDAQKLEQSCSILMDFLHFHIRVHASTDNMYGAIDKCVEKLFALISKYKQKFQSKKGELSAVDIEVNVLKPFNDSLKEINDDIEEANKRKETERYQLHEIVAKEVVSVKIHTQDEAVMRLEFSNDPFLIYRSEEDQKVKILYRRSDNNYNLLQIQ